MEYKGIEIIQLKNKNLLLKLPYNGQTIISCRKFLNDEEKKKIVDNFIKKNPDLFEEKD